MKKASKTPKEYDDDMLPEYGFAGKKGVRGKYYLGPNQAHAVHVEHEDGTITKRYYKSIEITITLAPDVAAYFSDSESVNNALRTLIALVPQKQVSEKKAKYSSKKKPIRKIAVSK